MRTKTSFLTRCFAMFLALVMLATSSNMGIVLQAFAAEQKSVALNQLMVEYYGDALSAEEKALLGQLACSDTVTYTQLDQTDAEKLIKIDANAKQVTMAESEGWKPVSADVVANGVAQGSVDMATGKFDYDEETYAINVRYQLEQAVSVDAQNKLLNAITTLKAAHGTILDVIAQDETLSNVESAMKELADLVSVEGFAHTGLLNAYNTLNGMMPGGKLTLRTKIDAADDNIIAYLAAGNGAAMQADAQATAAAIEALVAALNDYSVDAENGLPKQIADAESKLAEAKTKLEDAKAKAMTKLDEKYEEMLPDEASYNEAVEIVKQYNDAWALYNQKVAELEAAETEAEKQALQAQIDSANGVIATIQPQYDAAVADYEKYMEGNTLDKTYDEVVAEAQAELAKAKEDIVNGRAPEGFEDDANVQEAAAKIADANAQLADAEAKIQDTKDLQDNLPKILDEVNISGLKTVAAKEWPVIDGLLAATADLAVVNANVAALGARMESPSAKFTFTTKLSVGANMEPIAVIGKLTYFDANGVEQEVAVDTEVVLVPVGSDPEKQDSFVTAAAKVKADLEAKAAELELDLENHFTYTAPTKDSLYNATYAPNSYVVTYAYSGATEEKFYGEKVTLETNPDTKKVYEYTVTVDGTTTAYEQGEVITVEGATTIEREEVDAYVKTNLLTMIAEKYPDAAAVLNSGALKSDRVVRYREPVFNLSLVEGVLSMPAANSYGTNKWTAVSYKPDNGALVDLKSVAGWAWNADQTASGIANTTYSIDVVYQLLIADTAEVKANLDLVNALITDANGKVTALDALASKVDDMALITYGKFVGYANDAQNADLDDAQKQAFAAMRDNAFDGANLTLQKLIEGYTDITSFYANAQAYIKEVNGLNGDLNAMLSNEEKLTAFLGDEIVDALKSVKDPIEKAAGKLALHSGIKTDSESLSALGTALKDAKAVSAAAADLVSERTTTQAGEGKVTLTITLKPEGADAASYAKVFTKDVNGQVVITVADIAAVKSEVKAAEATKAFFTNGTTYTKYYTNNFDAELDAAMANLVLTDAKTLNFTWTYKVFDITVPGMPAQQVTLATEGAVTNVLSLAASSNEGEWYEYQVNGRTISTKDGVKTTALSGEDIDWIQANGVKRNVFNDIALTITMNIPDEEIEPIKFTAVMENGEAVALDVDGLKAEIAAILENLGEAYYVSEDYDDLASLGTKLSENKDVTYNWEYREFTVKVEGMDAQTITLGDSEIELAASQEPGYYYNYNINDNIIETTTESKTYKFEDFAELFGDDYTYEVTLEKVVFDPNSYQQDGTLLGMLAAKYPAIQAVVNAKAFVNGFDEVVKYNRPTDSHLTLDGSTLNVLPYESNGWTWNASTYKIGAGAEAPVSGTAITMPESGDSVYVKYLLTIASQAKVQEKLAAIDTLIEDANAKKSTLNGLASKEADLAQLDVDTLIAVQGRAKRLTDPEERQFFLGIQTGPNTFDGTGVIDRMVADCFNDYGYDETTWLDYLDLYFMIQEYKNDPLTYYYTGTNADKIIAEVNILIGYLEELEGHKASLDALDQGMGVHQMIVDMKDSIINAANNLQKKNTVANWNSGNKPALIAALNAAADYTAQAGSAVALTDSKELVKVGQGKVTLNITLKAEDGVTATIAPQVYTKAPGADTYVLTDADVAALKTLVNAAIAENLGAEKYSKYFTNNCNLDALVGQELTGSSASFEYLWSYKTYTVTGGVNATLNIDNRTINLPAAPEGQMHKYVINGTEIEVTDTAKSYAFTEAELDTLFAGGSYTVSRTAYDKATLVVTVKVGEQTKDVTMTKQKAVGETYTVTADDVDALKTPVQDAAESMIAQGETNYYEFKSNIEDLIGKEIDGTVTETLEYGLKNYTVKVEGMDPQIINKDNMTITLAESTETNKVYKYVIKGITYPNASAPEYSYTFTYEDLTLVFDANAEYSIARIIETVTDKLEKETNLLALLAEKYPAIKALLNSKGLTTEDVYDNAGNLVAGKYDETLQYNEPKSSDLTLDGTNLTIPAVESGLNDQKWNPYGYSLDGAAMIPMAGAATVEMPMDATYADAYFRLVVADKAKTAEKLAVIDALVADGSVKKAKLAELAAQSGRMEDLDYATFTLAVDKVKEKDSDGFYTNPETGIMTLMARNCFDINGSGYLKIYNLLQGYQSGGLGYFYEHGVEFNEQIGLLSGYMQQMLEGDRRNVLKDLFDEMGMGSAFDMLDELAETVKQVEAALKLHNAIDQNAAAAASRKTLGAELEKLVASYDAGTYTALAGSASDLTLDVTVRKNNAGTVSLTVVITYPGQVGDIKVPVSGKLNAEGVYELTATDIAELKSGVEAAVAQIKANNADFDFFYTTSFNWDSLPASLTADVEVPYEFTQKTFTVTVEGGKTFTITLDNAEIELPVAGEDSDVAYKYVIGDTETDSATYKFSAEEIKTLFVDGAYTVKQITIDQKLSRLEKFVASLNDNVGGKKFVIVEENGTPVGITGNIGAGDMMGLAQGLAMGGYTYLGLNTNDLLTDAKVHMQALVDAMLSDANFGSETIIALGSPNLKASPAHLLQASLQVGMDKAKLDYDNLTFLINMDSVPANMANYVNTASKALTSLREIISFQGSGIADAPEMKVALNMTGNVKGLELEKIYEVYLTALIGTGNVTKDNVNEITNKIAFQFLKDYIDAIVNDDAITLQTFENTLAKVGTNVDLSEYEDYYQMGRKFWKRDDTSVVCNEDAMDVTVSFGVNALLNKLGVNEGLLTSVYEYANNVPLHAAADAVLKNVETDYQALVLDVNAAKASGLVNKANAFDYTTNLPGRMAQVTGQSAVILLSDVTGNISFPGTAILDLNGHTVNGNVTAGGKLFIVDSRFETNTTGAVTGTVSGSGVAVVGGHYAQDVSAYLPEGYIQENGYVRNALFSVEVQNNNITYVLDSNVVEAGISEYVPFAQTLAVDIAVDLALNYFTAAALSIEGNGIYAVDFGGLLAILDTTDKIDEVLRQAVEFFNEAGITNVTNMILDDLLDFKGIKAALEGDGIVATYNDVVTNAWQIDVVRDQAGDYLDLKIVSGKEVLRNNISIKVGGDHLGQVKTLIAELADITEVADINVNLANLEYIGSSNSLQVVGDANATYHADLTKSPYATVIAVVLANGGSAQSADLVAAVNANDKTALKDAFDKVTVQEIFTALKVLNRGDDFAALAKKVGVTVDVAEAAELENIYHLFLVVGGKGLEVLKIDGMNKAMGGLDKDDDGVYEFATTVSREGEVGARGYFVDYNAGPISVDLAVKLFAEEVYILPENLEINGIPVGPDSEIVDTQHAKYGDQILATSYTYKSEAEGHDEFSNGPTGMQVWQLDWVKDAGEYKATEITLLNNVLQYKKTAVRYAPTPTAIRFATTFSKALFEDVLVDGTMTVLDATGAQVEVSAFAGTMLDGYKVKEVGTIFGWDKTQQEIPENYYINIDTYGDGGVSYVYAAGDVSGEAATEDFIWFTEPDTYTGTLEPIAVDDAGPLARERMTRAYMTLECEGKEDITIYGGSYVRSIYYVAKCNEGKGTNYVMTNFIDTVIATVEKAMPDIDLG